MTQKEFCRRPHLFYGESFPLYVTDAKPKPQPVKNPGDDNNRKLERVLLLLTQLLGREQKARDRAKQRRFNQMCTEAQQGYRSRNPHTRQNQNRISLRVENDQKPAEETKSAQRHIGARIGGMKERSELLQQDVEIERADVWRSDEAVEKTAEPGFSF